MNVATLRIAMSRFRAAKLLNEELDSWRTRPFSEIVVFILNARYNKMCHGSVAPNATLLLAISIGKDELRWGHSVLVALSEAEVHWRDFLDSLAALNFWGVEFITSNDYAGMRAAPCAVLGKETWQRRQFHFAQNAIHHTVSAENRKDTADELRTLWNVSTLAKAETALARLVANYRYSATAP